MQQYLGILVIISCAQLQDALEQCRPATYSVYGHHLSGHVVSTRISSNLSECIMTCFNEFRCKSLNLRLMDKSCDLNDESKHSHPEDYGRKEGSIYMDMANNRFKSCAEIHQGRPQAESGYYWVTIGDRDAQVYCDMKSHGGGWTLVVIISSTNNEHLQSPANNCFNSVLCVPFTKEQITARKLRDEDIHKLAQTEGTFRVDVLKTQYPYTVFYQIPSGPENFNSACGGGNCPRIIISHSYPYKWETNDCTTIDVGYHIYSGYHRVFDGHDDNECSNIPRTYWTSSRSGSGRRALYGYPYQDMSGIYPNMNGMLFVK